MRIYFQYLASIRNSVRFIDDTHIESLPFLWIIYLMVNVSFKHHFVLTYRKEEEEEVEKNETNQNGRVQSKWRIVFEFVFGVNACSMHVWNSDRHQMMQPNVMSHGHKNGELIFDFAYSMSQLQVSKRIHFPTHA